MSKLQPKITAKMQCTTEVNSLKIFAKIILVKFLFSENIGHIFRFLGEFFYWANISPKNFLAISHLSDKVLAI